MFEFLSANPAVSLLKEDLDRVKAPFDQFKAVKSRAVKVKIVRSALAELKVHPAIEEELFLRSYYGQNLERLVEVKRAVAPAKCLIARRVFQFRCLRERAAILKFDRAGDESMHHRFKD